jgi:hypothetical protein
VAEGEVLSSNAVGDEDLDDWSGVGLIPDIDDSRWENRIVGGITAFIGVVSGALCNPFSRNGKVGLGCEIPVDLVAAYSSLPQIDGLA